MQLHLELGEPFGGYVDEVILPSETRARVVDALAMLEGKRQAVPAKKHGNIPL